MLGTRYYSHMLSAQAVWHHWEATANTRTTATNKENKYLSPLLHYLFST